MPATIPQRMLQDAELAGRFFDLYRRQFADLIQRLNQNPHEPPDRDVLRLCIEAVDMMLATNGNLTRAILQLGAPAETKRQAA